MKCVTLYLSLLAPTLYHSMRQLTLYRPPCAPSPDHALSQLVRRLILPHQSDADLLKPCQPAGRLIKSWRAASGERPGAASYLAAARQVPPGRPPYEPALI